MPKYDNYDYNTMGFGNDPLAQNAGNGGLLNLIDDAVGGLLFGDPDASSKIVGELTGYNKQQREFAQQEYMQDKQWAHDSAVAQMARAKEAGINLNTAAAGIAGGNVSATAPAVSSGGNPASAVDAVSGLVSSISGAGLNAAEAANQEASANKTNAETPWVGILSHANNMKLFGDFVQSLKDVGMSEIHAGGIAFDLMNGGLQKSLDYLSACSGIRNIDEQMKFSKLQYDLMKKEVDSYDIRMNADLSLKEKEGLKAAAEAAKFKAETWYQERKNSLENSIQGITMLQGGNLLFNTAWKYGVDSPQFKALEDSTYKFAYAKARGGYDARVDTAYEEAFNLAKGSQDVKNDSAEFESMIRQNEEWIKGYINFLFHVNVSDPVSMVADLIKTMYALQSGDGLQDSMRFGLSRALRNNAKPDKGGLPHYRDFHNN